MWTRRTFLSAAPLLSATPRRSDPLDLRWSHLPEAAQRLSASLGLTDESWDSWQVAQRGRLRRRVDEGTAEHLTYYFLQSQSFTADAPLDPTRLAHTSPQVMPPEAQARARAFLAHSPQAARHRLLRQLHQQQAWPLERCYEHTMAFLKAKELERRSLEELYHRRGLSSDTSPASTSVLARLGGARRILLAGPGLDLTRREKFSDGLPLRSHQLEHLRARFPGAHIEMADVRPEVIQTLGAQPADITTQIVPGTFDWVIATNLLLYFEDRELLTALAGLAQALAPGGRLLHNDQRFAAKVFGEAVGLPLERFEALPLMPSRGVEQWDRAVVHRKGAQS